MCYLQLDSNCCSCMYYMSWHENCQPTYPPLLSAFEVPLLTHYTSHPASHLFRLLLIRQWSPAASSPCPPPYSSYQCIRLLSAEWEHGISHQQTSEWIITGLAQGHLVNKSLHWRWPCSGYTRSSTHVSTSSADSLKRTMFWEYMMKSAGCWDKKHLE